MQLYSVPAMTATATATTISASSLTPFPPKFAELYGRSPGSTR